MKSWGGSAPRPIHSMPREAAGYRYREANFISITATSARLAGSAGRTAPSAGGEIRPFAAAQDTASRAQEAVLSPSA